VVRQRGNVEEVYVVEPRVVVVEVSVVGQRGKVEEVGDWAKRKA
jgi:hypothetical protein